MIKYLLPTCILCFCTIAVFGQHFKPLRVVANANNFRGMTDCNAFDWIAGTSSQALDPAAQSNDVAFLCFNDILQVTHDGNSFFNPATDPSPANSPGINYVIYDCLPTFSGPSLTEIINDPCVTPPPPGAPATTEFYSDSFANSSGTGTGTITNNGAYQNFFNSGNPLELYFAPITIHDFIGQTFSGTENDSTCVNATPSDAFRVVFLNEIAASNINNNAGSNCIGSFDIAGGLPQWNQLNGSNSNYTIAIAESGNPANVATITSGAAINNSTVTFTVSSPGTYDVSIDDGKSCGVTFSVDIAACVAAAANFTATDLTCNGANDGSILIDIISGTAPFTITWQLQGGGAAQNDILNIGNQYTINGLTPGIYDVTISDANGLNDADVVTINEPGVLGASLINLIQPYCNGGSSGNISVEVTLGGVVIVPDNTYTFDWGASSVQTTQTITNISSGAYSVMVSDGNGCTATAASTLSQPSAISAPAINVVNASCLSSTDGSATINATGGTGTLSYIWSTVPSQNAATANNIAPGTYTVTVTDANLCTYTSVATISAVTELTATTAATNITCNGANDGQITAQAVLVSGVDNGGYSYTWSNAAAGTTITNLIANNYTVTIEDAAGCTATSQATIVEPVILNVTTNVVNESCTTGNDGQVNIVVTGGTGTFLYVWSNGATTANINNLSAGTYTVTVSDVNNCTTTAEGIVMPPSSPTINSMNAVDVLCSNSTNGAITVNATAGVDPIDNYLWSNNATTATASNLAPGTYTVTVTDVGGCQTTASGTVNAPTALVEQTPATTTVPSCPSAGDASITLDITGGVPISASVNYSYEWSNGNNAGATIVNTINNLTAGNYTITVTDGNNCTLVITDVIVVDPPAINVIFQNLQPVSCSGAVPCDGQATVVASGGQSVNYTFTWETGEVSNGGNSTAVQLCQGFQQVTVTDGFCTIVDSVEILAPPVVGVASVVTTDASCNGDTDGTATITPTGGDGGPYTITWSNGQVGATATNLDPAVVYTVNITDNSNCQSPIPFSVTVQEPAVLSLLIIDTVDISCNGAGDGVIQVAPVGGNQGQFTYEWSHSSTDTLNIIDGLEAGTYNVTVTDEKNCTANNVAVISEPQLIVFSYTPPVEPECFGEPTIFGFDNVSGGTGPYTYTIDGFNFQSTNQASPILAGDYTIIVSDSLGCSVSEAMTVGQPSEIIVDLGPDVEIQLGESYEIIPNITPLGAIDSFVWTPTTYLDCTDCLNPTATPLDEQVYSLTVVRGNCEGTGEILIDVDPNRNVFIPNVFTPNGDDINDNFTPFIGVGVTNINKFTVFDRWGEVVFYANNFVPDGIGNNGWDGRLGGKLMNPAVFIYVIEVAFADGQVLTYKGDVSLIR